MKNRTVIGLICMALAVAVTLVVAPLMARVSSDTVEVPRLSVNVARGSEITEDMIEKVSVKKDTVPEGVLSDESKIIGLYSITALFAGDYLTEEKITENSYNPDTIFSSLDGSQVAMSVTVDSFAAGLSGKLENGDIVSVLVKDPNTGKTRIPSELTYVKVITTTTAGGIDQDKVVRNEDGSYELPETVTLLVNIEQALILSDYEDENLSCVLVYRGSDEVAEAFLGVQEEYFKSASTQEAEIYEKNSEEEPEGQDPESMSRQGLLTEQRLLLEQASALEYVSMAEQEV